LGDRYRCFLPDLAGFAPPQIAWGPTLPYITSKKGFPCKHFPLFLPSFLAFPAVPRGYGKVSALPVPAAPEKLESAKSPRKKIPVEPDSSRGEESLWRFPARRAEGRHSPVNEKRHRAVNFPLPVLSVQARIRKNSGEFPAKIRGGVCGTFDWRNEPDIFASPAVFINGACRYCGLFTRFISDGIVRKQKTAAADAAAVLWEQPEYFFKRL